MLWWAEAKPGSQYSDWVEIADMCKHWIYSFSEQKINNNNNNNSKSEQKIIRYKNAFSFSKN